MVVRKIVSGGQTGVDRAALDWALEVGCECGGWCPAGRLAEDGPLDDRYPLVETPSESYAQRTEWNVRDSEGTVIFSVAKELRSGSALTRDFARKWNRPCLHISQQECNNPVEELLDFVDVNFITTLNVAGPRKSTEPEAGIFTYEILYSAFGTKLI